MGSFDYLLKPDPMTLLPIRDNTWEPAPERPSNVSIVSIVTDHLPEDFEERAAITEFDAGIPREWAEAFARVQCAAPLAGYTPERWLALIDDGGRFLDRWAARAMDLGWSSSDCFGLDPKAPEARVDKMGLVPLIDGREVVAITDASAVLQGWNGSRMTYHRRNRGGVPLWELVE